jgi:hypothetical protein
VAATESGRKVFASSALEQTQDVSLICSQEISGEFLILFHRAEIMNNIVNSVILQIHAV